MKRERRMESLAFFLLHLSIASLNSNKKKKNQKEKKTERERETERSERLFFSK